MCSHYLEVPSVAPELAHRTLRSAFTIEQGRVFLSLIEVWGQYYPAQHIFAVSCLYPLFSDFPHLQLAVNMLIFVCKLCNTCLDYLIEEQQVTETHD